MCRSLSAVRRLAARRRIMSQQALTPPFSTLLQDFFCQRLINQRNASACTIAAYRDTFRVLFQYLEQYHHKQPVEVTLADLDAPLILAFLDYLQVVRRNSIGSRNARLAALRSFFKYALTRAPASLPEIQRVLAIPMKRQDRRPVGFLSRDEVQAILDAPDPFTWSGQRDRVMFRLFYNTGARVSEIVALRVADLSLDHGASICLRGKGRKERAIPLWKSTAGELREWMGHIDPSPTSPLLPNTSGKSMSRSGVEGRLKKAVAIAVQKQPALANRAISPHTIRHTTAVHLLQSGVDLSVIALWLGHESTVTTHQYIEADLSMKERTLEKLQELPSKRCRYRPSDKLLQFLENL
jgi:site-specific recombinase XerD